MPSITTTTPLYSPTSLFSLRLRGLLPRHKGHPLAERDKFRLLLRRHQPRRFFHVLQHLPFFHTNHLLALSLLPCYNPARREVIFLLLSIVSIAANAVVALPMRSSRYQCDRRVNGRCHFRLQRPGCRADYILADRREPSFFFPSERLCCLHGRLI